MWQNWIFLSYGSLLHQFNLLHVFDEFHRLTEQVMKTWCCGFFQMIDSSGSKHSLSDWQCFPEVTTSCEALLEMFATRYLDENIRI